MSDNIQSKMIGAAKWSTITEFSAKIISPITNMILARIISPEAFGVVATVTMITSFVDMFTDAGFQKYLVQHNFKDDKEKNNYANVAFWTNLCLSVMLWGIIIIFSQKIAELVGNPGLGNVIGVACIQLPLTSFSSIQMAIYRRSFNFKTLFLARIIGICIPFIVTIPLAILGYSYWALIIGNICGILSNAIILTIKSKWKPRIYYNFKLLKNMLTFSVWSLLEAVSIWLTSWIDTFIIGSILSSYYLGIYKTSLTAVNGIFSIITAASTPILFSALSRTQNDKKQFYNIFFSMQKIIAYLVFPLAIGMFIYNDIVVDILLGNKWSEANDVVAIWGLTSGIMLVMGNYASELYRAKGMPKLSFLAQMLHLIVLVPVCLIAANYSFMVLVNSRALIRLQLVVIHLIIMKFIIKISLLEILNNIKIPMVCSLLMGAVAIILKCFSSNFTWKIISILICIFVYISLTLIFKESRKEFIIIINNFNICDKICKFPKIKRVIWRFCNLDKKECK